MHEIGLLFFHYLARSKGFKTFYLGQSLPHEDLKIVYRIHKPDILITSLISSPSPKGLEKYLEILSNDFPLATIFISGLRLRNTAFRNPKNIKPFYKATELPALLDSIWVCLTFHFDNATSGHFSNFPLDKVWFLRCIRRKRRTIV